ncbi:AraC family transcriptional regulator [Paenibacillus spongiae]|uniref:AraC family transcriptional regulator n=1 Tax=Paenibacillus spongiae TaxID=2909671 RepID=A0ABY5SFV2_9BACL|nr:AraC family transcriptional regulator [Paenibacillus spongiae]UVI31548.1 AraC family transcriptional regulator [Paenibacillus spongiae]
MGKEMNGQPTRVAEPCGHAAIRLHAMSIRIVMHEQNLKVDHITTDFQTNRKGMLTVRHQHPVFHLMYITEGLGEFLVNDKVSKASAGLLYIINPNEWHQFHGDEHEPLNNLECTFLVRNEQDEPVEANFFDWVEEKRGLPLPESYRSGPIFVPGHLRPFLIEGFQRLLDPGNRYVTAEHLSLMVADLLLRTEETIWQIGRSDEAAYVQRGAKEIALIKQYMRTHLAEPVKLEKLSQLIHWSPNYLCRIFKEHTGKSPMAYLQSIRMMEAEKLLLYTDLPIFAISELLGYDDASYFARLFRRHHGRAPTEYRII